MINEFELIMHNALTPIVLISGVGLVMLSMTNRYNNCTDRIRQLIREREANGFRYEPDLDREILLVYKRAAYLRKALLCISLSAVFTGAIIAVNLIAGYSGLNLAVLSSILLVGSLGLIMGAATFFSLEVGLSLHALSMAVNHLPPRPVKEVRHADE